MYKDSKHIHAMIITTLVLNILNIIGFICGVVHGISKTVKEFKEKGGEIDYPYHKEDDGWYDSYGNKIIPKCEQ